MNTSDAWYALRRTLPPWRFEPLLEELIEKLPSYKVDELILKVDVEEFSHGYPSIQWLKDYQPNMFRLKEELEKIGIVYSLNPWITKGHADRARCVTDSFPGMQPIVDMNGSAATDICCSLSPEWRAYTKEAWTIYAETKPHVIWIEDDCREFGDHACYCPLHLQRFAEIIGREVSREEIIEAILKPGDPHPWRAAFLKMKGDVSSEAARFIAQTVHAVSPSTRIGLMSSGPRNHCAEGRDWNTVAESISLNGEPVYSRPTMGNYWEYDLRGYYFSQDSIKITRHALPDSTIDQTEVENVPFSRYANSSSSTALKLWITFGYGAKGATMNLFNHMGSFMEEEPSNGQLLASLKPKLNSLAKKTGAAGRYRGIRLIHRDDAALSRVLSDGADMTDLRGEGREAMMALESAGIPTTYEDSDVVILTGSQPSLFSDDEVKDLLSKGLFLDGPAAHLLCARGFGNMIGLKSADKPLPLKTILAVSAEDFSYAPWGGAENMFMSSLLPTANFESKTSRIIPMDDSVIISSVVDPDRLECGVQMTAFENALGGRVVVHAWDYKSSVGQAFHSPTRTSQLQAAAQWLCKDRVHLLAKVDGAWPLAFRKDTESESVIGLYNISLDPYQSAELTLATESPVKGITVLDDNGDWSNADNVTYTQAEGLCRIAIERSVKRDKPIFICVQS